MKILRILRCENGKINPTDDALVEEKVLNVYVNGEHIQSLFYSNGNEYFLGLGVLLNTSLIKSIKEVRGFSHKENEFSTNYYFEIENVKDSENSECEKINAVSQGKLFSLMKETLSYSETFAKTGGTHIVSVGDINGILAHYEDISRLSSMLKCAGYIVDQGIKRETIVFTSGRINYTLVEVANKMNSKIIVSQSAVSTLAVKLGEDLGITLVGFMRGNRFNIYTHPERITY